jgi:hypothetical protein
MVKRGRGGGLFIFYICFFIQEEGGFLERGLKERGLNIDITVHPFLPLFPNITYIIV